MSIRNKLFLGLTVGLLFVTIMGLLSYSALQTIVSRTETEEHIFREHDAAQRLQLAVQEAIMPPNDYLITGNPAERERFATLAARVEKDIAATEALAGVTEGNRALLAGTREKWQQIRALAETILALPNPVGDAEGTRLMQQMDALADELTGNFSDLHRQHEAQIAAAEAAAHAARTRAEAALLVVMALILAGGLTFAWRFSAALTRSLTTLVHTAEALGRGDLETRATVEGDDEVARLSRAVDAMATSLQDSYTKLEARNRRLRQLYELAITLTGSVTEVTDHVVTITANLLDVQVALVEEIRQDKIAILSMFDHGQIINEGEFPLQGTPCENVWEERNVCHYSQAVEQFPEDPFLAEHGLVSYLGVPILDSQGEVLGVVNVMDDRERAYSAEDIRLIQTLAKRVSVEIERAQMAAAVEEAHQKTAERAQELDAANRELATLAATLEQRVQAQTEDLEQANATLQQKQAELETQNAELSTFVYMVSHDLKSPVVSIQGFLSLLKEQLPPLDDEAQLYLDRIQVNANQMAELAEDLLELSRLGRVEGTTEDVPLRELVDEICLANAAVLMAKGIRVEYPDTLPTVHGDRQRLHSVLANLLDNAARYVGDQPQPVIRIGVEEEEGLWRVWVQDNGIGIAPAYHEKVFELFQRLKDVDTEGTGLGLTIVRQIIERHDGRVWVESTGVPGQGATLHFTLPKKGNHS